MSSNLVDYKVSIGHFVRNRLARNPSVFKIPSKDLELFVAREFLSRTECEGLMRRIDVERIPSQLLSPTADPEFRTSESCNMNPSDPLVRQIEDKISGLMGIESEHGETIQGQRYTVGQQFKPHYDYFSPSEAYWPTMERCGGQRTWTAMVFLNAPDEGGQTAFPDAELKIAPRPGNLLTWNNMDLEGRPNPFTLHQGCPVLGGTKYVITKWYRERPWRYMDVPTY